MYAHTQKKSLKCGDTLRLSLVFNLIAFRRWNDCKSMAAKWNDKSSWKLIKVNSSKTINYIKWMVHFIVKCMENDEHIDNRVRLLNAILMHLHSMSLNLTPYLTRLSRPHILPGAFGCTLCIPVHTKFYLPWVRSLYFYSIFDSFLCLYQWHSISWLLDHKLLATVLLIS